MKTKSLFQTCEFIIYIFYSIFGMCYSSPQYNCDGVCAGLEESTEHFSDSDYISSTESLQLVDDFNHTGNASLRFATPCETPNHEVTYCMEISKCAVLYAVKHKKIYADFVQASRCGPANEDQNDFKVCCGRYNGFRNVSKIIDNKPSYKPDDLNVLPKKCGTQRHIMRGRIVGGTEAVLGEYPWMARIIHKNDYGEKSYGCAGFLIHTKYVVTAAHCIHSEFSKVRGDPYSVLLGEHNVSTAIDCTPGGMLCADPVQSSRINKIIVHENYSEKSKNHHNDIALIHLKKAIKLSEFVQPICLLEAENPEVKKYYISGWGKTETGESSNVKLKVDLNPFDKEQCKEKFQIVELDIYDSQICAGGEKMKDSCNGDSGGPLMMMNGTHYFAAGLVSYGIGCGMQGWPGVYTSIPSYLDWIKIHILDISTRSPRIKNRKKKNKKRAKLQSTTENGQEPS